MRDPSGQELAESLLKFLQAEEMEKANSKEQSYYNTSSIPNMSGNYNGLQVKIHEINPTADYVTCFAHALNLIGHSAVDCILKVSAFFFYFADHVYTSFNINISHLWEILLCRLGNTSNLAGNRLCDIRWSALANVTAALNQGYDKVKSTSNIIANKS